MTKIFKPLMFAICLVLAFGIGYAIGPGKAPTGKNDAQLKSLQKQLAQKRKQIASLQESLKALKEEQQRLRKDLEDSQRRLGATSSAPAKDGYADAGSTDVGDLTFYSDLPKQDVNPEPLQAGEGAASKPAPSVNAVKTDEPASQGAKKEQNKPKAEEKPGTSSKPLDAKEAVKPTVEKKKAEHAHADSLPGRYIPPGFNGATAAHRVPKTSKGGRYLVQVASYKTESGTAPLRKKLAKLGFSADVKVAELHGKHVYRVVVGPYAGYSEAKKAKSAIKSKLGLDALVVKTKG